MPRNQLEGFPFHTSEMDISKSKVLISGDYIDLDQALGGATGDIIPGSLESAQNGFWPDLNAATQIWRMADRVFVGEAVDVTGNRTGTQGSIIPTSTEGANWALRDSQCLVIAATGLMAVTGISRSSDKDPTQAPSACIGLSGFVINDRSSATAWGAYIDGQHESGATTTWGIEIALKNKGSDVSTGPTASGPTGVVGVWLPAGSDASYGGSPANPNNIAVAVGTNSSTWNSGIVMFTNALTNVGSVGAPVYEGIQWGKGTRIKWVQDDGSRGATIRSDVNIAGRDVGLLFLNNLIVFESASGSLIEAAHTVSGVNYFRFDDAVTGSAPTFSVKGADTDIDLKLSGKGAGLLSFGTHGTIGAETVTGYITIKDSGGTTRKLAVVS